MKTSTLLLGGTGAAVLFVAVVLVEGVLRPGYDPVYHTGSELELGDRGWVQRGNFFVMGAGVFALATGIGRVLDSRAGAILMAVFGVGMIIAGMFPPDAVRGYPPGAPSEPRAELSWQHRVHHVVSGPIAFLALLGACLVLAARLGGAWQMYTMLTAVVGLALTVWTAVSFQRDAPKTGLVQRALILVYWTWLAGIGLHLA